MKIADLSGYLIYPNPDEASLTSHVTGRDHTGTQVEVDVVTEVQLQLPAVSRVGVKV